MKALLKIEWIKTWRSWPVFIMGIGMPVGFFLLFSSIVSAPTPEAQKEFLLSYMLTMTGFSMSSFGYVHLSLYVARGPNGALVDLYRDNSKGQHRGLLSFSLLFVCLLNFMVGYDCDLLCG